MYLYITPSKRPAVEIPGITLEDGYIPKIGGQILPLKADDESYLQLEPAVWFKVLVLDSINLDCEKRVVMWNSGVGIDVRGVEESVCNSYSSSTSSSSLKRRTSKFRKRISESMYLGGECYGYGSDLDEAFEIAQQAVHDYLDQFIPKLKLYETVLRILHCYILPSIQITPEECPKLRSALSHQDHMVEKVERRIMKEHNKAEDISRAMYRQRLNFVEQLSTLINSEMRPTYPQAFGQILYEDIQQDLKKAWESVNDLQTAVDEAKVRVSSDPSNKSEEILKECRSERDRGHHRYEKLLKVREILHGMNTSKASLDKSKKKKSKKSKNKSLKKKDPLIDIYMGMIDEYNKSIEDIVKITDQKVLVLSVKEAVKQTLEEIDKGEEAAGIDINNTGLRRPTDVLRHSSIPKQWKTLTEQVTTILLDTNHILASKHEDFCSKIIAKCNNAKVPHQAIDTDENIETCNSRLTDHIKQTDDSGCEVELSTSNPRTCDPHLGDEEMQRESDLRSSSRSSAAYIENSLYSNMKFLNNLECDDSNESGIDLRRKGDSTVYMDYDPLNFPRDSTLASLANDQCSSCFGRLSLVDPTIDNDQYNNQHTDSYQHIANGCSPDSGALLDSVRVVSEGLCTNDTDDAVVVYDLQKEDNGKINIDILKANIREHFDNMCKELEEELHCVVSAALHRKVWFCYESHFYERTMRHLTNFYEYTYAPVTSKFCESLLDLTVEHLELESSFVLHLLQEKDTCEGSCNVEEVGVNNDNDAIEVSIPVSDVCSLEDTEMVEMMTITKPSIKVVSPSSKEPQSGQYNSSAILSLQMEELPPIEVLCKSKSVENVVDSEEDRTTITTSWSHTSSNTTASAEKLHEASMPSELSKEYAPSSGHVSMRRSQIETKNAMYAPDAPKPNSTRKRLSVYYADAADIDSLSHDTNDQYLSPIRESLAADDVSGSSSTISSCSNSSDSKKGDTESSSENLLSSKDDDISVYGTLSERLALFTASCSPTADRNSLTSIKVYVPCTSVRSSMCERSTWPLLNDCPSELEAGLNLQRSPGTKVLDLSIASGKDHLILKEQYKSLLVEAEKCIQGVVNETSPLLKLQFLTKSLRELSEVIKIICEELFGSSEEASADNQLDFIVVFLCNCTADTVGKLYVNINLLTDIIPTFMESGPFAYALVQFTMAISFLNDRILRLSRGGVTESSC